VIGIVGQQVGDELRGFDEPAVVAEILEGGRRDPGQGR